MSSKTREILLRRAKQGSVEALDRLTELLESNWTALFTPVSQICLNIIDKINLPELYDSPSNEAVDSMKQAFVTLATGFLVADIDRINNEDMLVEMSFRMSQRWPNTVNWSCYFVQGYLIPDPVTFEGNHEHRGQLMFSVPLVLAQLCIADGDDIGVDGIDIPLSKSTVFASTAAQLWIATIQDHQCGSASMWEPHGTEPFISCCDVMATALSRHADADAKEQIVGILLDTPNIGGILIDGIRLVVEASDVSPSQMEPAFLFMQNCTLAMDEPSLALFHRRSTRVIAYALRHLTNFSAYKCIPSYQQVTDILARFCCISSAFGQLLGAFSGEFRFVCISRALRGHIISSIAALIQDLPRMYPTVTEKLVETKFTDLLTEILGLMFKAARAGSIRIARQMRKSLYSLGSLNLQNYPEELAEVPRFWLAFVGQFHAFDQTAAKLRRELPLGSVCGGPKCPQPSILYKDLWKCPGCHTEVYCSRECQKEHWKDGHGTHCRDIQAQIRLAKYPFRLSPLEKYIINQIDDRDHQFNPASLNP